VAAFIAGRPGFWFGIISVRVTQFQAGAVTVGILGPAAIIIVTNLVGGVTVFIEEANVVTTVSESGVIIAENINARIFYLQFGGVSCDD